MFNDFRSYGSSEGNVSKEKIIHQPLTDDNYVDLAELAMRSLINNKEVKGTQDNNLTSSKLRTILSMTADIYNRIKSSTQDELNDEIKQSLQYLRVRCLYEAGRDNVVKEFMLKAGILGYLKEVKTSRRKCLCFCRYIEALVAYHKYLSSGAGL